MDDQMDCEDQTVSSIVFPPSLKREGSISESSMDYKERLNVSSDMDPCDPIPIDETVLRNIKLRSSSGSHTSFASSSDLQPWPSESQLAELVRRASDVWIYAQTVIRFVEEPQSDPRTRLQLVLRRGSEITDALESLDALYSAILSVFPPMPTLPAFVDILRAAAGGINPEDIDDLMQFPSGAARCSLRGLNCSLRYTRVVSVA
ncbi:hypothetical protein C8F04DRAFT_1190293 [Mycena alexandri]|uniref:Uncharacterized protein n=1 Tax=Mycena alexandri TaxID=1745969 RepID=A0AAD6SGX6_9AGAR|nr:hypothetical protein C8F04DRAFT_1190293 [Mycena alexandri]